MHKFGGLKNLVATFSKILQKVSSQNCFEQSTDILYCFFAELAVFPQCLINFKSARTTFGTKMVSVSRNKRFFYFLKIFLGRSFFCVLHFLLLILLKLNKL